MLKNPSPRDDSVAGKNSAPPEPPVGAPANSAHYTLDDNATHAFIKLETSAITIQRVSARLQRGQLLLKDARRLAIAISFLKAAENELEHACAVHPRIVRVVQENDLFR